MLNIWPLLSSHVSAIAFTLSVSAFFTLLLLIYQATPLFNFF